METIKLPKNYLLYGSLIGLFGGLLLGIIAETQNIRLFYAILSFIEPLGTLWINSLRMIVLPLIIAYIITAVASFSEIKSTFKVGGGAIFAHLVYLGIGFTVMIALVPHLVTFYNVTPELTQAIQFTSVETPQPSGTTEAPTGLRNIIVNIIPVNLFSAAANNEILPLFVAALLFGLALTRVPQQQRRMVVSFFKAIISVLYVLIQWILMVMPYAVFILVFSMASQAGSQLLGALIFFVVLFCGLLLFATLLLYVVTPIVGRVSLRKFAQSSLPAQTVAIGSRSSMVCLPALIEGAKDRLGLPEKIVGLVMPLAVSMFKYNKVVSGPIQIFFLAHIYGIQLEPWALVAFFMAYIPTSFSSPGIPSGGFFVSLPLYIALGIPVEGVVLLRTVDAIPDIFKTIANVTEDMSVAALVSRYSAESATSLSPLPD